MTLQNHIVIQPSGNNVYDGTNYKRRARLGHGGATLIELLVVLVIFSLLAASAIPMLSPIMSNRQYARGPASSVPR